MQVIFRLTILGSFAVAGVALAISVAANTQEEVSAQPPLSDEKVVTEITPAHVNEQQPVQAKEAVEQQESPAEMGALSVVTVTPALPPPFAIAAPPFVVPYESRVATQLDSVLAAIDRIAARQDRTALVVSNLQQQESSDDETDNETSDERESIAPGHVGQ